MGVFQCTVYEAVAGTTEDATIFSPEYTQEINGRTPIRNIVVQILHTVIIACRKQRELSFVQRNTETGKVQMDLWIHLG